MRARVLFLALAALLLLPFSARAQDLNCYPPADGNWFVNETVVCQAHTLVLNGSLLINASGNLTLEDSLLQFNSSFNGQFGVENNGSLYLIRSTLENSSDTDKAYTFVSNYGAKLEIRDSFVYQCGYYVSGDSRKLGLYVNSNGTNITNTTFQSNYIALLIYSGANNISGNRIHYNYGGIAAHGSGNAIRGNIIAENSGGGIASISGNNVILENNVVENNTGSSFLEMPLNNSLINNNVFFNNSGGAFGILGNNNNITNNRISANPALLSGIEVLQSGNTRVTGNTVLDNAYGLLLSASNNTVVSDNFFNRSSQYDVYMLSAANATFSNTSYSTLIKKWYLNVRVLDNESNPMYSASVVIQNSFAATVFSGSTNAQGTIAQQLLDERQENASGVFVFNPYTINATKSGYYSNATLFNLTGDMLATVIITPLPPPENVTFNFTIQSPVNATYMKYNLTSNLSLELRVTSDKNMSWCNYSFGNESRSLTQINPWTFQTLVDVSAFEGPYRAYFVCNSTGNLTYAAQVYFTLYPLRECNDHPECNDDQQCQANTCVILTCTCGYPLNHACVAYACCLDSQCGNTEQCNLTTHTCQPVSCPCPEKISNHACNIETGYCCSDNQCTENETCSDHECVERTLSMQLPESLSVGQNITVMVFDQDGLPAGNVKIVVEYPDADPPLMENYYTGSDGKAEIPILHWGRVEFALRKGGYYTGHSTAEVPEPLNFVFLLEVAVVIGAAAGIAIVVFRFLKKGGGLSFGGPLKLEKMISGNRVLLRIRNQTKKKLQDITIRDSVPRGAFLRCGIMPRIEPLDAMNSVLTWEILELEPREEVTIEYETRLANRGFSVLFNGKVYRA